MPMFSGCKIILATRNKIIKLREIYIRDQTHGYNFYKFYLLLYSIGLVDLA